MSEKKRKLLVVLGIILVVLATVSFMIGAVGDLIKPILLREDALVSINSFFSILQLGISVLTFGVLVAFAILQISEGMQLRKVGLRGSWSTLCGVGDIFFATMVFVGIVMSIVLQNFESVIESVDNDRDKIEIILLFITVPAYLSCIAAGVIYLVSGVDQGKMGKPNLLLIIAGICLVVNTVLTVVANQLLNLVSLDVYSSVMTLTGFVMLAGRVCRGLAPFAHPKPNT